MIKNITILVNLDVGRLVSANIPSVFVINNLDGIDSEEYITVKDIELK